jgi:hypothetical protein
MQMVTTAGMAKMTGARGDNKDIVARNYRAETASSMVDNQLRAAARPIFELFYFAIWRRVAVVMKSSLLISLEAECLIKFSPNTPALRNETPLILEGEYENDQSKK